MPLAVVILVLLVLATAAFDKVVSRRYEMKKGIAVWVKRQLDMSLGLPNRGEGKLGQELL